MLTWTLKVTIVAAMENRTLGLEVGMVKLWCAAVCSGSTLTRADTRRKFTGTAFCLYKHPSDLKLARHVFITSGSSPPVRDYCRARVVSPHLARVSRESVYP